MAGLSWQGKAETLQPTASCWIGDTRVAERVTAFRLLERVERAAIEIMAEKVILCSYVRISW